MFIRRDIHSYFQKIFNISMYYIPYILIPKIIKRFKKNSIIFLTKYFIKNIIFLHKEGHNIKNKTIQYYFWLFIILMYPFKYFIFKNDCR